MHTSTRGAAQAARTPTQQRVDLKLADNEALDGTFWWPLGGERTGRIAICPMDREAPMVLAVTDDFGSLVPVPSIGAHSGLAGVPA